jgi:hypothetical protein
VGGLINLAAGDVYRHVFIGQNTATCLGMRICFVQNGVLEGSPDSKNVDAEGGGTSVGRGSQ